MSVAICRYADRAAEQCTGRVPADKRQQLLKLAAFTDAAVVLHLHHLPTGAELLFVNTHLHYNPFVTPLHLQPPPL